MKSKEWSSDHSVITKDLFVYIFIMQTIFIIQININPIDLGFLFASMYA